MNILVAREINNSDNELTGKLSYKTMLATITLLGTHYSKKRRIPKKWQKCIISNQLFKHMMHDVSRYYGETIMQWWNDDETGGLSYIEKCNC